MQYKEYPNREEWLQARKNSLGASEVASAMGMGFETQLDLWKEKTETQPHKSLDDNERVNYGTQAEEHIRALFELKNKDKYKVEYFPFRIYQSKENPFMTCTLDGELTRLVDGKKGGWEGKTAWIMSSQELSEWDNRIPDKYFIQVLPQRTFAIIPE